MNSGMHLNDEQLAALVVEDTSEFAAHTRSCAECAAKAEALRAQLADFGGFVRANAERTNTFWWRQRATAPAAHSFGRWAMAAAAVVVVAAVSVPLIQHTIFQDPSMQNAGRPAHVVVRPAPVQPVSDEALLGEVQSDVVREYPDAFAPVGTNAETAVAAQVRVKARKKDHKKK